LEDRLYKEQEKEPSFMLNILRLVLTLKKQAEQEKKDEKVEDIAAKVDIVRQTLAKAKMHEKEKDKLHLCKLIFMEDIIPRIDKKH
jgi:hypothetical protein